MFGKNEVAGPMYEADGSLLVNSIFYTLQGEGPDAGTPSVFIRLAKCNLRCYFCDTEFETGERMTMETVLDRALGPKLLRECRAHPKLAVITGGEPLLQNIAPLAEALNEMGVVVAIETAGTVCPDYVPLIFGPPTDNYIVCSPKTPNVAAGLIPFVSAWKYVVGGDDTCDLDDGLPVASTQRKGYYHKLFRRPEGNYAPIFVSPMDEQDPEKNLRNTTIATNIALGYGYRLSIQMHKLPGVALP